MAKARSDPGTLEQRHSAVGSQVKTATVVLGEDTYAGQRPENAVERVRMRSRDCRQRGRGLRAGNEQIGKPELGGNIDRLGYPRAGCQIE